MKYWHVEFTGYVTKKWITYKGDSIQQIVGNYVKIQNEGCTKSERIKLLKMKQITEEEYRKLITTA